MYKTTKYPKGKRIPARFLVIPFQEWGEGDKGKCWKE
jgi:hypothetical protein